MQIVRERLRPAVFHSSQIMTGPNFMLILVHILSTWYEPSPKWLLEWKKMNHFYLLYKNS